MIWCTNDPHAHICPYIPTSIWVLFDGAFFSVSIFKREITYSSTKIMEKHIWRLSLLVKRKTSTDCNMNFSYSYVFYIHFRNVYFKEHPWIAASFIRSTKKLFDLISRTRRASKQAAQGIKHVLNYASPKKKTRRFTI